MSRDGYSSFLRHIMSLPNPTTSTACKATAQHRCFQFVCIWWLGRTIGTFKLVTGFKSAVMIIIIVFHSVHAACRLWRNGLRHEF